jgi:hypothetical protein
LSNLSILTKVGTGGETFIVGFTVGGAGGNLPVLVRGVGPGLTQPGLNIAGAHPDPAVSLFSAANVLLKQNDDWGGDATVTQLAAQVGAFPLAANSKDAALVATLGAGGFSAQITGPAGTSGLALAEIYDATPSATAGTSVRLTNCSARAFVGVGDGILTAGFVIAGDGAKKVLIRGVGPSLKQFNLTGVLDDPLLAVFAADGSLVANNDDWGSNPVNAAALSAAFAQVGAFPMTGTDSKDSALIATLPAGRYSAQIHGFAGGTGIGLIEVYELP